MLDLEDTDPPRPLDRTDLAAPDKPEIEVLLAVPRGFCAGVTRAIDAVRDALAVHGAPVYVRRPIVHNLDVVRALEAEGAIFVQELDEVPVGAVVLFSAHGVAPAITEDARERRLTAFDAVCPLVDKVHREVRRHHRDGRQIVLIGHPGHPEIEGTAGHVPEGALWVVSSVGDVEHLTLRRDAPTAYAVQTTYSVDDAAAIVEALRQRFSDLAGPSSSDICYATTNRQLAVREIAANADAVIVVGEQFSSNACRLAEVAATLCAEVQLVASPDQLEWSRMPQSGRIGITAAASTPESAVEAVLAALARRYRTRVEEFGSRRETTVFKRMAVRDRSIQLLA
jgi:4-hydroxy-3-methylbut-2-enyl diphosphate reductase